MRARTPPSNVSSDGREKKVGRTPPLLYLLASTQHLMTSSDSSSSFPSFSMFSLLYLILAPATVTNRIWCPILFPRPGSQLSSFLGLNGHGMGYRENQAEKLSLVFFLLLWSSSSISFPLSSPSQISISKKKDKLRIYLWGKRRSFLLKVRFILSLSRSCTWWLLKKKEKKRKKERKTNSRAPFDLLLFMAGISFPRLLGPQREPTS